MRRARQGSTISAIRITLGSMQIVVPRYSRRRFLGLLGQGALLAGLPPALLAEQEELVTISILHTTDLHGHILPTSDYAGRPDLGGLARCASQVRQWQRDNPNWALIDIGDIYQGTEEGLATHGAVMVQLLNALAYDAWVIGNHEFDWGIGPLADAVKHSAMPVLSGNSRIERGTPAISDWARLQPWFIKEVAGFRLAFIGLTTPGLASWLPPEDRRGFDVLDPIETLQRLVPEVAAQRPDAIILAGHMGLTRRDDFANRIGALTQAFPQFAVCIGGHTHQNHPGETINGVLYTQADHFGIHAGKVDLTFDRATRRLVHREAMTVEMNRSVAFDPLVLHLAQPVTDAAAQALAQPMGLLAEPFDVATAFGKPSDVERLIGSAVRAALLRRNVKVDVVALGLFDGVMPMAAGPKTVADAWALLPYENQIVTLDLTRDDLLALVRDLASVRDVRNAMGIQPILNSASKYPVVTGLYAVGGAPLPDQPRFRVALNSYDAQSGGQRLLQVARLTAAPENRRVLHDVEIRAALIDFFVTRQRVSRASLII
jgi:2',3'-cyclic-nucleotide 2'-phosphodiesterase (5'-nucleotidase family)